MNQEQFDKFVANFSPERAIFFTEDPLCILRFTSPVYGIHYQEVYRIVNLGAFAKDTQYSNVQVVWVHPSVSALIVGANLRGRTP